MFPQDAMSELLKLMSHVADQTPGTSGKQWQHPSDATRRYILLIGFLYSHEEVWIKNSPKADQPT